MLGLTSQPFSCKVGLGQPLFAEWPSCSCFFLCLHALDVLRSRRKRSRLAFSPDRCALRALRPSDEHGDPTNRYSSSSDMGKLADFETRGPGRVALRHPLVIAISLAVVPLPPFSPTSVNSSHKPLRTKTQDGAGKTQDGPGSRV